mgnify:CR=1 FL=1
MRLEKIKKCFANTFLSFSKLIKKKDKSNDDDSVPHDHYPLY